MTALRIFVYLLQFHCVLAIVRNFGSFGEFKEAISDHTGLATANVFAGISKHSCESDILNLQLLKGIQSIAGGDVVFPAIVVDDDLEASNFTECAQVVFYPVDSHTESPLFITYSLDPDQFQGWVHARIANRVEIFNDFHFAIDLHWTDESGSSWSQGVIETGSSIVRRTMLGHIFLAYRQTDNHLVDFFVANGRNYRMSAANHMGGSPMLDCLDTNERLHTFTTTVWQGWKEREAAPVNMVVVNHFPYQVELFWTDEAHEGVSQALFDSGHSQSLSARMGHTFFATRTSDGAVVDYFVANGEPYFMKAINVLESCHPDKLFAEDVKMKANGFVQSVWDQKRRAYSEHLAQSEEFAHKATDSDSAEGEGEQEEGEVAEEKDDDLIEALHRALHLGDAALVSHAVEHGADVDHVYTNGWTPLLIAAHQGHLEAIKVLMGLGANVSYTFQTGWTAVMAASEGGFADAVSILLDHGARVDDIDENGFSALIAAARGGHVSTLAVLLDRGANINYVGKNGWSVLSIAAAYGEGEAVKYLLERGADVNVQDPVGVTALMAAARNGHVVLCALLLSHGADTDLVDNMGYSALVLAAQNGYSEVVDTLLDHGVDLNSEYATGMTALIFAAQHGQYSMLVSLLDKGALLNQQSSNGMTALMAAVARQHSEAVTLLIERGALLDPVDKEGKTALMVASQNGDSEIVTLLLDKGALVDIQSNDGNTALMFATENGHHSVVSLLLDKNAETQRKNKLGKTALQLAEAKMDKNGIELLKPKSGKANRFFFF